MNANHIYIIIGVAAISALLATVALYLMNIENTTAVIVFSAIVTGLVIAIMLKKQKKSNE